MFCSNLLVILFGNFYDYEVCRFSAKSCYLWGDSDNDKILASDDCLLHRRHVYGILRRCRTKTKQNNIANQNVKPIPDSMKFEKGLIKLGDDISKAYEILGVPTYIGHGGENYVWRYGQRDLYAPAVIIRTIGGKRIFSIATDRWAAATTPDNVGPGVEKQEVIDNYGTGRQYMDTMRTGYYVGRIIVMNYGYTDNPKDAKKRSPRMRIEVAEREGRVMYLRIADRQQSI